LFHAAHVPDTYLHPTGRMERIVSGHSVRLCVIVEILPRLRLSENCGVSEKVVIYGVLSIVSLRGLFPAAHHVYLPMRMRAES